MFTSVISLQFVYLRITYLNNSNNFFSKTIVPIIVDFHMKRDQTHGFQKYKIGSGQDSKMEIVT